MSLETVIAVTARKYLMILVLSFSTNTKNNIFLVFARAVTTCNRWQPHAEKVQVCFKSFCSIICVSEN
jgi:hypothetical protein